ncbi:MAG TPA: hemerythrin [Actinomycetota bacterium]
MTPQLAANPAGWPQELLPVFDRTLTCEFASISRTGRPITWPLTPFPSEDGEAIEVSTGLTYPSKAERARRNPKVAILFSDDVGSGLDRPPMVLVQGLASVRDADLQANTDLYVQRTIAKLPEAWSGVSGLAQRRRGWYWIRIWVRVTPLRIQWWPQGRTDEAPHSWRAPAGTTAPPSDPAPVGPNPKPWQERPTRWRERAAVAVEQFGRPVLTVIGQDGFPTLIRTDDARLDGAGFVLDLPAGIEGPLAGNGSLTFHARYDRAAPHESAVFVGHLERPRRGGGGVRFTVDWLLGDFRPQGSRRRRPLARWTASRRVSPRIKGEAARRGQGVPHVRPPDAASH